ncbi:MAG: zinc ABC transporter substrate-binding protein [Lachnospiraceae bacterium]|nr:zinc ABC transporter substrate-binding protein [Lachnospiraceae bacterium]
MKRHLWKVLSIVWILAMLVSGCGSKQSEGTAGQTVHKVAAGEKIKIVTTIFPLYDWTREVLGEEADRAELTLLIDKGVDLHSYQPTAADMMKIADADIFIYVGGESDGWVKDALPEKTDKVVLNLMDIIGDQAYAEEVVEGMEAEEEEDEEEEAMDEHIWMSPSFAKICTDAISNAIVTTTEDNDLVQAVSSNTKAYKDQLDLLSNQLKEAASKENRKYDMLLVADRYPFRYLSEECGLEYRAPFLGCSAETEASFEKVAYLAGELDKQQLPCILVCENNDQKLAKTILENSSRPQLPVLELDSMQSITAEDIAQGKTYLSIMQSNLEVIRYAVGSNGTAQISTEAANETPSDVDIDLTTMNSNMVYSEVYQMMYYPEDFVGKTIRMNGDYTTYADEELGVRYFACIIKDATACCAQGIEFELTDSYTYPEDYPKEGETCTVKGEFELYQEDGQMYCRLKDAELENL